MAGCRITVFLLECDIAFRGLDLARENILLFLVLSIFLSFVTVFLRVGQLIVNFLKCE